MNIVLDIHNKMENEKRDFRKIINEFSEKLCKIEDKKAAVSTLDNFKHTFLESKMNWQERLKSIRKETEDSLLYAGLPLFATTTMASLYGNDAYDLTHLSKGLMLTGIATIGAAGKELRKNWNSKKSNYFLEIGKHLISVENSSIRVKNFSSKLHEFVND
jgi:hypothetical protein